MAVFTAIATAITSAFFAVAGAMGATLATATLATIGTFVGYVGAAVIYGGVALAASAISAKAGKRAGSYGDSSVTYGNPILQTQTNQDLPIPLLYGTCKLAGNRIWQDDNVKKNIKRIVGFAEGEIEDFTDIRLNNIETSKIKNISVNKYLGTSTQIVDNIIPGDTQEAKIEKVGSLKNVAYLAINVPKGDDVDANYNLTSVVKGRKIRVYHSSNKSNYSIKYSENPAWVMLDFLISYNGLGLALNSDGTINDQLIVDLFDLESFIESANFCDEEIPWTDNEGKTQYSKRFTFNMIFDSQSSARDLMDEIYRSCRGGLFTKNGKLQFKVDKAQPVCKVFTADDIVKGSETFQTIPTEEHYDILKVVYISPEHEWQKVEAFAEIPEYRDGVPIEHAINCYSVTNFQQASRLAWYYVNSKILCPYFGSFKTDYRAYDLEVGDVIQFDSLLMGLSGYKAKVTSLIDDGAGTFTVNWRTYDERLYDDTLGSKKPRVLVSKLTDDYEIPDNVQSFNVTQNQQLVEFSWTQVDGNDITYEIREGETWASGKTIANNINGLFYTTNLKTKGIFTYWIKAKNRYNDCETAKGDILNVQFIPNTNEVVKSDILLGGGGTLDDMQLYHGRLSINIKGKWTTTLETWKDSGVRYYADKNNKWGGQCAEKGVYTSQIYDIGANLNNIVNAAYDSYKTDSAQSVTVEFRYSEDSYTWSNWVLLNIGSYKFQYYQVRVTFNNPNKNNMYIKNLILSIDVPDRLEEYTNRQIVTAEDGLRIDYATDPQSKIATDFIKECPHVLVTPFNTNAYPDVIESKPDYCLIKLYTNNGVETTGNVNISVSGY